MKNLTLYSLLLTCIVFNSCKDNKTEETVIAEKPISVQCYKAIYEQDTLDLKINNLKSGKVTGNMEMAIFNSPKKVGEIAGEFRGDTLFVNYSFSDADHKETKFKNPMAFLKRNNQLILGNGEIATSLGASYFVKGKPIDFDRVKYKFSTVDCVEK